MKRNSLTKAVAMIEAWQETPESSRDQIGSDNLSTLSLNIANTASFLLIYLLLFIIMIPGYGKKNCINVLKQTQLHLQIEKNTVLVYYVTPFMKVS